MKTYHGARFEEGCDVWVEEDGKHYPLPWRLEIRNHSPTGLEWGYGGSGPAQLALAILADHFGPAKPPEVCPFCNGPMDGWACDAEECGYDGEQNGDKWRHILNSRIHYQDFKTVIAGLDKAGFCISSEQINNWISHREHYA